MLISLDQYLTAVLVVAMGLTAYGCKDTASISNEIQVPLSSLSITPPGVLQPAFSSDTTDYTATVPTAIESVTVTATPKDSTTTISINGTTTPAGSHLVSLGQPGSTTVIVVVTSSQNGIESTYRVTVTRLSNDNNLLALQVTANNVVQPLTPKFEANTPNYTANVSSTVGQITVAATKSDPIATMLMSSETSSVTIGPGVNSGQLRVTLGEPGTSTLVTIDITAPDGSKKIYQITVNRLSGNNTLRDLSIIPGDFDLPFNPTITSYIVTTPTTAEQVTVTATKSDRLAAMSGSVTAGAGLESGTEIFNLGAAGSELPLSITVTAPDPTVSPLEYRITVKRAFPSSNANLSALTTSPGSLDPPIFAPDTLNYAVKVSILVGSVTITATKSDPNAVMLIGSVSIPAGTSTGQVTISPGLGPNPPVEIRVTAQDGVTIKPYTVTVTRSL